jgi:hypothetical protein
MMLYIGVHFSEMRGINSYQVYKIGKFPKGTVFKSTAKLERLGFIWADEH